MFSWFKKDDHKEPIPEILGLRPGYSFEVDALLIKLLADELTITSINPTQFIHSVGLVELDDTFLYRFYTDDDAWLQVVTQGGKEEQHIVDVKLFHYYDTLDVSNQNHWNTLLAEEMGTPSYPLNEHMFQRVWSSAGDYHNPVAMTEVTWDKNGDRSQTDVFTMLYERLLNDQSTTESLFLSAEEQQQSNGHFSRCLVISTGITLTPSQLTVHG